MEEVNISTIFVLYKLALIYLINIFYSRKKLSDRIHCKTRSKLSINESNIYHEDTKCKSSTKDDFLEETSSMDEKPSRKSLEKLLNIFYYFSLIQFVE